MHGSRYGSTRVSTPLLSSRTNSVPTPLHSSCLSMTLTLPPDPSSSLSSLTVEHNARLAKILRKIEQIDAGDADAAVRHAALLPQRRRARAPNNAAFRLVSSRRVRIRARGARDAFVPDATEEQ